MGFAAERCVAEPFDFSHSYCLYIATYPLVMAHVLADARAGIMANRNAIPMCNMRQCIR